MTPFTLLFLAPTLHVLHVIYNLVVVNIIYLTEIVGYRNALDQKVDKAQPKG